MCLAAAPLFHIAGLNGLVLPTFLKGGTIVVHRRRGSRSNLLRDPGPGSDEPVRGAGDARRPGAPSRCSAQRTCHRCAPSSSAGPRCPNAFCAVWAERGVAVQQGYGLTETAPAVLKLAAEDGIRKAGSAGKPQFLVDVRLVAPSGSRQRPGRSGRSKRWDPT